MGPVNLNEIAAQERQATRDELNSLFKQFVCETTCIRVVKLMDEAELKRLLALHLFDLNVVQYNRNRGLIMCQLRLVLGVSKTTMYRWFPAKEYKGVQGE